MMPVIQRFPARTWFALVTFVPIPIFVMLAWLAPPDGNERSQWMQFLGHFHPIAVHLPIAILTLVPVMELAARTRYFRRLLPSIDFLLGVAIGSAMGAVVLGWSLARSGSYSGTLVTQHMWGGVFVVGAAWCCWLLRTRKNTSTYRIVYCVALAATLALVSFTGYRGGQLSQGENHLTEHMPAPLRAWFRLDAPTLAIAGSPGTDANSFYALRIQPVFSQHCVSCHGAAKHKAKLRLDSYQAVMRGSKNGAVIKPGQPKASELFHRITLPLTDDDFMPAEHKPPLSSNELKRIELWISSGASGTQPASSFKGLPVDAAGTEAVRDVTFPEINPNAVAKQRAPLASAVEQLQRRFPSCLNYEARDSSNLTMDASILGPRFGDDDLAALRPIAAAIVSADFSRTAITDRSAGGITAMKQLRSLRLMNTKITDTTVESLGALSDLSSLNLFGTDVTAQALASLSQLPKLHFLYVHGTKISPDTDLPAALKDKVVF